MAYPTYIPAYNNGINFAPAYQPQSFYQPPVQPVQSAPTTPQNTQGLSSASRLVTSKEEAMGVPADFMGGLMVFPDVTHNRIYTKHWNAQTGAADFMEFSPVATETAIPASNEPTKYALAEELESVKSAYEELRAEVDRIKKGKAVKKNDTEE